MQPISPGGSNPLKRKRVVLSIETKLQIIERLLSGETFTKLGSEYGIGTQTVRDILHNKDKLINFAFSSGTIGASLKRKSLKKANFQDIDKAVFEWFQQQRAEGIPISGPMLIEKALCFHKEMKINEPFLASSGWLTKFKTRYNIHQPKTKDDKLVSEELAPDKFRSEFKNIVQQHGFTISQIYMVDETVLYWKELPKELTTSEHELGNRDGDDDDDCITVMACASSNCSKKLKLFCTGKISNQMSTESNGSGSPVDYFYQGEGVEYDNILTNWFFNRFIPVVRSELREKSLPEKAVLILNDNLAFQKKMNLQSEDGQFFTLTLPKSISQLLQMGQNMDIIKTYYQRKPVSLSEESNSTKEINGNWSFGEALNLLSDIWAEMLPERMQQSSWWWRNLFTEMGNQGIIERSDGTHFMVTRQNIKTEDVLDLDDSLKMCYPDYEIKNLSLPNAIGSELEDKSKQSILDPESGFSVCSNPQKIVSLSEALSCAGTLLTFLEQQNDCYNDVLSVRNINIKLREKLSSFYINRYGSMDDSEVVNSNISYS